MYAILIYMGHLLNSSNILNESMFANRIGKNNKKSKKQKKQTTIVPLSRAVPGVAFCI